MTPETSPLAAWETFYVILGSSCAALTGLIFVAVSLIPERRTQHPGAGLAAFAAPTVTHLVAGLLVSSVLSAPWREPWQAGFAAGVSGLIGAGYCLVVFRRIRRQTDYRPVREDEFYSSGFLSENQKLPFGKLLGSLVPQQISTVTPHKVMRIYSEVGVCPPEGAKYEVGDTLLIVRIDREINDWGQVIVPTGLARVTEVGGVNNIAVVVQQYAEILNDQFVLPAEKFPDPGNARTVPISDGVAGKIIQSRDRQPLKGPRDVLFIDRGRSSGVAIGDVFEVRSVNRLVEGPQGEAETGEELMALVQVVHVSEKTATVRIAKVTQPNIQPGSGVKQIAKLPS